MILFSDYTGVMHTHPNDLNGNGFSVANCLAIDKIYRNDTASAHSFLAVYVPLP
jgi:hypothetical protein